MIAPLLAAILAAGTGIDAGFERAVLFGRTSEVAALLDAHPDWVRARDRHGFTALHNVMCEEKFATMALLVERGADVDARNDDGIAPLHLACWPQAVDVLVGLGADVDARSKDGRTPLLVAADEEERLDVVEALLRHGADVDARDTAGATALAIARWRHDAPLAALLVAHGAKR